MRKFSWLLLLACTIGLAAPLLKPGDRLVVAGDGYVGQHGVTVRVAAALALHHPGSGITVRVAPMNNLGFLTTGLPGFFPPLLDADVLSVKPRVVVLSFGAEKIKATPVAAAYRQQWFTTPLTDAVKRLQAAGVQVLLTTPPCLDPDAQPALKGAGEANQAADAQAVRDIAVATTVPVIDLYALLHDASTAGKAVTPGFSLYDKGGTLTTNGQALVTNELLRALGETGIASSATIDAAVGTGKGEGCTVTAVKVADTTVTFTRDDTTLPLAWMDADQYMVKVTGLRAGPWKLAVGDVALGAFTADALAAGVALPRGGGPWAVAATQAGERAGRAEGFFAERCGTLTHVIPQPDAEPERQALLAKFDAFLDAYDAHLIPHAWTWTLTKEP